MPKQQNRDLRPEFDDSIDYASREALRLLRILREETPTDAAETH
jgi:hypothetical protein